MSTALAVDNCGSMHAHTLHTRMQQLTRLFPTFSFSIREARTKGVGLDYGLLINAHVNPRVRADSRRAKFQKSLIAITIIHKVRKK